MSELITVVDGAQALGNIEISADGMAEVDYYVTSAHKWLRGNTTLGIVRGRRDCQDGSQSLSTPGVMAATGNIEDLMSAHAAAKRFLFLTGKLKSSNVRLSEGYDYFDRARGWRRKLVEASRQVFEVPEASASPLCTVRNASRVSDAHGWRLQMMSNWNVPTGRGPKVGGHHPRQVIFVATRDLKTVRKCDDLCGELRHAAFSENPGRQDLYRLCPQPHHSEQDIDEILSDLSLTPGGL